MRAKVFRKYSGSSLEICCKTMDENCDYRELITSMKKDNFRQVIFNTEILMEIARSVVNENGHLLSMDFNENIDDENQSNINKQIVHLRERVITFDDFINSFSWIKDSQSIDISNIKVSHKNTSYYVYANGVFEGEELITFFNDFVKKSIELVLE